MNFDALLKNLIYVLKESQMKIGYTDNAASLNYPPASLARLLGTEADDSVLRKALKDFAAYAEPTLGRITVGVYDGQYCLTVPAQGVRYVHENVPENPFLRELIDLTAQHKARGIAEVRALFSKYSDKVVCQEVEGDGYDHVLYFADGTPDDFIYLFETAFGHVTYHRMTKADYEGEIISGEG